MQVVNCTAGIFVGGRSKRLRGTPKGLLEPPGTSLTLVERLAEQCRLAAVTDIVLVGNHPAYEALGWPMLPDSTKGQGPLAGMLSLVDYADRRQSATVLAIACDMPFVDADLLRLLCREQADADALVPRREQREPLCARYRVRAVRPHIEHLLDRGQYRMMDLLDAIGDGCVELPMDRLQQHRLDDWDCPSDLPPDVRIAGEPIDFGLDEE